MGLGLGLGFWVAAIHWLGWGAAAFAVLAAAAALFIAWLEGRR